MTAAQKPSPARYRLGSDPGPSNPLQHEQLRRPTGGRDYPQPEFVSRRVQVAATDHPATDRWITLTTTYNPSGTPVWVVGVVDGFSKPTQLPEKFPTVRRARNAANRLFNQLTEEDR